MIRVVGRRDGVEVVSFELGHGVDPVASLAERGWAGRVVAAHGGLGDLVLEYGVAAVTPSAAARPSPGGPGLSPAERSAVRPRQRVAAYAVVVVDGALLLTQLSARTGAQGRWNLPGGGLDPGETPAEALVREVMEETGQAVDRVRLVEVLTQHWVGRGHRGPENHHAVRLVYSARCREPTVPVVHDVGGSTSDARWVPLSGLGEVPVVPTVLAAVHATGTAGDDRGAQS